MQPLKLSSLSLLVAVLLSGSTVGKAHAAEPNILIILADDCTYNDLPVYGGENARTPNLDQLANEGLTFDRAFLAEAMCQPCRAELYSGLFPMRNGCAWNHSASHGDIESMPQHLGGLGYRVGLAGKVHVQPRAAFPFESIGGFDQSCVRDPTQQHRLGPVGEFMARSDDPFCLVVALVEPHVPWVMGDATQYPPKALKLPPNIADTPETRRAFGRYLAEITYMDSQVGEILQTLEATGKADQTLVLFSSEQGSQFPGNKWTNYNTGVHTAMIARMPGVTTPGRRTDALIQYADVLPTLLEFAGKQASPGQFDGTSFAAVIRGESDQHRNYVYGVHNNYPEGPPYPIRSVSNGRYHYLRNLQNENLYIEKHLMGIRGDGKLNNMYWQTWVFECFNNPDTMRLIQRYQSRPSEELFDLEEDPYEMNNLAGSSSVTAIQSELGAELKRWMKSQGDPGIEQDTMESHQAAKKGEHRFRPDEPR